MAKTANLTLAVLRQLLTYDPETGILYWRKRGIEWFQSPGKHRPDHRMNGWNAKWAGKPAINCLSCTGYLHGAVMDIPIQAHRIAYALGTGTELRSDMRIDHINGIKSDNRIENLRLVTAGENARNARIYKGNLKGVHGVIWERSHKAWAVKINFDGKQRRIGRFKCFGQAVMARKNAERTHGYHPNHGRLITATGG